MRADTIQGRTLGVSLVLASAVILAGVVAGYRLLAVGIGAGIVLGSFNGFSIRAVLDRRAPILVTSFLRLSLFSLLALIGARLLGGSVWTVAIGVGIAQFVMVGVGVRQGWRA